MRIELSLIQRSLPEPGVTVDLSQYSQASKVAASQERTALSRVSASAPRLVSGELDWWTLQ